MKNSLGDKTRVVLIYFILLFVASSIFVSDVYARVTATKSVENEKGDIVFITIDGTISKYDVDELRRVHAQRSSKLSNVYLVTLNSRGGDLEAAIELGSILRKLYATANIPKDEVCYSSCVFILAGATNRLVSGEVGIHRPYLATTDARDFEAVQKHQRSLAEKAKKYLVEVNVFPQLYDAMVAVPPERLKVLSIKEQHEYGLVGTDPVLQELDDAKEARAYGLSKQEYLHRKAMAEDICVQNIIVEGKQFKIEEYLRCQEGIMRGSTSR